MADLRVPGPSSAVVPSRPVPVARAEAVRAAQRAFFETALAGEAQAAAPKASVRAPPAVEPAAAPAEVRVALDPAAPSPSRLLRPGSLLDIKV